MARPFVMHNGCRAALVAWLFRPGYLFYCTGVFGRSFFVRFLWAILSCRNHFMK